MSIKLLRLKRVLCTALFVLLLSVVGITKMYAVTIGDLYYSLDNSTMTATVTGHKDGTSATGLLIIPESVTYNGNTYTVTIISNYAFMNCSGFTGSLTIPNSVTMIGQSAFNSCSGFTGSLTIGNSVTTICYGAFYHCSGFTGSLTIGNSVTVIGEYAFSGCSGFTGSLTIGNSVTTIGNEAFYHCSGFTGSLTIGNSVTTISGSAFSGCSGFTGSLTIPNSVTTIGNYAFSGCSGFTGSLTLGNFVTMIGNSAFSGCSGFTGSLTIPNSVTTIGNEAFYHCSGFTGSLTIGNSVTTISGSAFSGCSGFTGSLTIPNSVTSIGESAFSGCSGFTGSLTIPNFVTTIGYGSFYHCSGFTGSLIIGNSVTTIGGSAFYECNGFTGSLIIGNSVTTIGGSAFYECNGFTGSLTIPNSVTTIGNRAFYNCNGFTGNLTIGNSVTMIGQRAFAIYNNGFFFITSLAETPPSLEDSGGFQFWNSNIPVYVPCGFQDMYASVSWGGFNNFYGICGGMVSVVADPEEGGTVTGGGVFEVGQACTVTATANEGYVFAIWTQNGIRASTDAEYTFYVTDDMVLKAYFVPDNVNIKFVDANVKNICVSYWDTDGDGELSYFEAAMVSSLGGAFENNSTITSFNELQYFIGLTSIDRQAFDDCSGLTTIVIPRSVTTIRSFAFQNCGNLSSITIPGSVTTIEIQAFWNNHDLTSVYYTGDLSQWCSGITFESNPLSYAHNLYVNNELITDLVIPESVTTIGDYAFEGCSASSLTIGNSVATIGNGAFAVCSFTGSLNIPNSVTIIGDYAFYGCSGFTGDLVIPNSVTRIGETAFYYCNGFTGGLTIGNSVVSIGGGAFYNCSGFTGNLTIGNSVTEIGDVAFADCSGFTGELTIPNSVTTIGDMAFYNCNGLTGLLTIPNSVISIGTNPFDYCYSLEQIIVESGNAVYDSRENCNAIIETASNTLVSGCQNTSIPNSVITIGDHAFRRVGRGVLTLPNSVTTIGEGAFADCYYLGSLTIPSSVTAIDRYAFRYCTGFSSINSLAEIPPTLGENVFYGMNHGIPVYVPCGTLSAYQSAEGWNEFTNIQEDCSQIQTQTINLNQGWNWFSTNVEITLDDLKEALLEALPGTAITIKSQTQNISYNPNTNRWGGTLAWDVSKMYAIKTSASCEITLEGIPVNPAMHSITIRNGTNWIAFPLSESISLIDAFAGFAINGDKIKSQSNNSQFKNNRWIGQITELEPGKGYIYISNSSEDRILTFPMGAK